MRGAVRHFKSRDQKWLRKDISVNIQGGELAEIGGRHSRRREVGLALIPAGTQEVIVIKKHVDRRAPVRPLQRGGCIFERRTFRQGRLRSGMRTMMSCQGLRRAVPFETARGQRPVERSACRNRSSANNDQRQCEAPRYPAHPMNSLRLRNDSNVVKTTERRATQTI